MSYLQTLMMLFLMLINQASIGQCIMSFPYVEDFENSDGGWFSGGTGNDWAWGSPAKPIISAAGSGSKCWITGGTTISFYTFSERSWVQSPCFDFTSLTDPAVSFLVFCETEFQYDGASFQYSIDNGTTWNNVGSIADPTDCINKNWFNYSNINGLSGLAAPRNGWSGTSLPSSGSCQGGNGTGGWVLAGHSMPYLAGKPQVIFRFVFGSGSVCNSYDGFAFDRIQIFNHPPLNATAQVNPSSCIADDGSVLLQTSGGTLPLVYSWNPVVSTSSSALGLAPGNYFVTISDSIGCTFSQSFTVPASPLVNFSVLLYPDTCNSNKGKVVVQVSSGTSPFQYQWSLPGITGSIATGLSQDFYTVTVTDSKGCSRVKEFEIGNFNDLKISLGNDTTYCPGTELIISPGSFFNYLWQDLSNASSFTITAGGQYFVEVTDLRGCTASDTITITEDCLHDVLFPNAFSPNGDGVNDFFSASGSLVSDFSIRIFNRWGQIVFESDNSSFQWNGQFKNRQAPTGMYFFKAAYRNSLSEEMEKSGRLYLIR